MCSKHRLSSGVNATVTMIRRKGLHKFGLTLGTCRPTLYASITEICPTGAAWLSRLIMRCISPIV